MIYKYTSIVVDNKAVNGLLQAWEPIWRWELTLFLMFPPPESCSHMGRMLIRVFAALHLAHAVARRTLAMLYPVTMKPMTSVRLYTNR
jgi:hypothetical protein